MEWLNIHRRTMESEAMLDAEASDVGTWLRLASYCAGQENGGRLAGAKGWPERKWWRTVRVEPAAVLRECPLWQWEGEDLHIEFYPVEKEKEVALKRKGGSSGAKKRWKNFRESKAEAMAEPLGQPEAELLGETEGKTKAELIRKGKEGKGMEEKGREVHAPGESNIPSLAEVRDWAAGGAGVDPAYAEKKWRETSEVHGWCKNGRLVDWRQRWLRYWNEDREMWFRKNKNGAAPGTGNGAGREPGDAAWWWTEDVATVEKALTGALLGNLEAQASRLREILKVRTH